MPLIITSRAADVPPGLLYVFSSTDVTLGNAMGRSNLMTFCFADDPESHPCTYNELSESAKTMGIYYQYPIETTWFGDFFDGWSAHSCTG